MTEREKRLMEDLDATSRKLAEARSGFEEAKSKMDSLARMVDAYKVLIAEGRVNDEVQPKPSLAGLEIESGTEEANKSDIVRKLAAENSSRGISGKDVAGAFRKAGISFHPNYAYSVLGRLTRKGELREIKKRYYPAENA